MSVRHSTFMLFDVGNCRYGPRNSSCAMAVQVSASDNARREIVLVMSFRLSLKFRLLLLRQYYNW